MLPAQLRPMGKVTFGSDWLTRKSRGDTSYSAVLRMIRSVVRTRLPLWTEITTRLAGVVVREAARSLALDEPDGR